MSEKQITKRAKNIGKLVKKQQNPHLKNNNGESKVATKSE